MKMRQNAIAFLNEKRDYVRNLLPESSTSIHYMRIGFTSLGAAGFTRLPLLSSFFDSHSSLLDLYISGITGLLLYNRSSIPNDNKAFATAMMAFQATTFLASFFHSTKLSCLILAGGYAAVFISNPDIPLNNVLKDCIGRDFFEHKEVQRKVEEVRGFVDGGSTTGLT